MVSSCSEAPVHRVGDGDENLKYEGVAGTGRPPSLLVVAYLVLNYSDYCYIHL